MGIEISIRPIRPDDIEMLIAIESKLKGATRSNYLARKINEGGRINSSLVAISSDRVVGFLIGTLDFGESGIPESIAIIETIGVDPDIQDRGIGGALFDQFLSNMRAANVETIHTLVDWKDFGFLKFLGNMGFEPSRKLSLEYKIS